MARFTSVLVVCCGLAAGCATTSESALALRAPTLQSARTVEQDTAYMERVEQQARIRGIGVTWVNPPSRRVKAAHTPR